MGKEEILKKKVGGGGESMGQKLCVGGKKGKWIHVWVKVCGCWEKKKSKYI